MPLAYGEISGNRSERRGVSERGMRFSVTRSATVSGRVPVSRLFACAARGRISSGERYGGTVFFRILAALLALLLLSGGCTTGTISATTPDAQGTALPANGEKQVGPSSSSPQLQALVNRDGQRLVSRSAVPGSFRFYVLDQPEANAH